MTEEKMKLKLIIPIALSLAVLLLVPGPSRGMSETFYCYEYGQRIQFDLTVLTHGGRTSWHIQATVVPAVTCPSEPVVQTPIKPISPPDAYPRAMIQRLHQGRRVFGILIRVTARLVKYWLMDQAQSLRPTGSD
jgi:hypothetical protein